LRIAWALEVFVFFQGLDDFPCFFGESLDFLTRRLHIGLTYLLAEMGQDADVLVAKNSMMAGVQNASAQASTRRVTKGRRKPDQASE